MSSFKEHQDEGQPSADDADATDDAEMSASMTSSVLWGQSVNQTPSTSEEKLSTGSNRSRSGSLDKLLDRDKRNEPSRSHDQNGIGSLDGRRTARDDGTVDARSLPHPPPSMLAGIEGGNEKKLDAPSFPLLHLKSSLRKTSSPTIRLVDDSSDKEKVGIITSTSSKTSPDNAKPTPASAPVFTISDKNGTVPMPRQMSDVPPRASVLDSPVSRPPTVTGERKKSMPVATAASGQTGGIASLSASLEGGSKLFRERAANNVSSSSEDLLDGGSDALASKSRASADQSPANTAAKNKARLLADEISHKTTVTLSVTKSKVATGSKGGEAVKAAADSTKPATPSYKPEVSRKLSGDKPSEAAKDSIRKISAPTDAAAAKTDAKTKGGSNLFNVLSPTSTSSGSNVSVKSDKSPTADNKGSVAAAAAALNSSDLAGSKSSTTSSGAKPFVTGSKPNFPAARTALHYRTDAGKSKGGSASAEDRPVTKETILQLSDELRAQLDGLLSGSSKHYSVFMQLSERAMNFHTACTAYVDSLPPHGKFQFRELLTSLQTVADGLKMCNASAYEKKVGELRSLAADISTAVKR